MMSLVSNGQDPQFSQVYASPLYLNPALAGDTPDNRMALTYRNQYSAIENGYSSYIASYDHSLSKINSGIGASFIHDRTGTNGHRVNGLSVAYSYDVKINRSSGFKAGMNVGYFFRSFDKGDFVFTDQLIRGGNVESLENGLNNSTSYVDLGSGILYYNEFLWAGIAATHLNTPNISLIDQDERLARKFSIHAGVKVFSHRDDFAKELSSLRIVGQYKIQDNFHQLDLGAYYNFQPLVIGVFYRGLPIVNPSNNESIIMMLGIEHKDYLRIAYSYDLNISKIGVKTGGSHEISLIYEWTSKKRTNYSKRVACPRF